MDGMSKRRGLFLVTAFLALVAAGTAYWAARPTPLRARFDLVQFGQSKAEVEVLLGGRTEEAIPRDMHRLPLCYEHHTAPGGPHTRGGGKTWFMSYEQLYVGFDDNG